jgi:predicted N-formylglutamate amidohydrolase
LIDGAVEIIQAQKAGSPLLISCEHASQRMPPAWSWDPADAWIRDTHWAYDIGAAVLVRELCAAMGAGAVLANFTRLLVDPNRPAASPTLVRTHAEGREVVLNSDIDDDERGRRLAYWEAYHSALDAAARDSRAPVLLAIHSFTPSYEGQEREFDLGVLFDQEEELGARLAEALRAVGDVRLNEPYSGKAGLIYSAQRHADARNKRAIEIEARHDRLQDPTYRRALIAVLASFA